MYFNKVLYLNLKIYLIILNICCCFLNSFFLFWMFMEMSFLIFLLLLYLKEKNTKVMIIYFIMQFFSSIMLVMSYILSIEYTENLDIMLFLNQVGLMIKLGIMPLHFWYVSVFLKISWSNVILLSTVQKFIPLCLLYFSMPFNLKEIIIILLLNFFFTAMFVMKTKSLKLIFCFSSIYHSAWMILNFFMFGHISFIYFFIYCFMVNSIFKYLDFLRVSKVMYMNNLKKMDKMIFFFLIFSYSGLPPFTGFVLKWMMISNLTLNMYFFMIFMILLTSLIFMFSYLKMISMYMNMYSSKLKFMKIYKYPRSFYFDMFITLIFFMIFMCMFLLN